MIKRSTFLTQTKLQQTAGLTSPGGKMDFCSVLQFSKLIGLKMALQLKTKT